MTSAVHSLTCEDLNADVVLSGFSRRAHRFARLLARRTIRMAPHASKDSRNRLRRNERRPSAEGVPTLNQTSTMYR